MAAGAGLDWAKIDLLTMLVISAITEYGNHIPLFEKKQYHNFETLDMIKAQQQFSNGQGVNIDGHPVGM